MSSLQGIQNAWLVVIGHSKPKLWLIELEKITTKPICMDVNQWYEYDKVWGEKHFWFKCARWMSSLQGIQKCLTCCNWTFQTKLWLIELEKITTKPICMDVNLWYEHDKLWGEKQFWFKCAMWMSSLQGIQKCSTCCNRTFQTKVMANRTRTNHNQAHCMDVNQWYEHDKLWGEKQFWFKCAMWMSSLQGIQKCFTCCNWTFPKTKLWLIELEKITTKPICMDVNLWYEHDKLWGEKQFWFKCAMWMSSLQGI